MTITTEIIKKANEATIRSEGNKDRATVTDKGYIIRTYTGNEYFLSNEKIREASKKAFSKFNV